VVDNLTYFGKINSERTAKNERKKEEDELGEEEKKEQ